MLILLVFVILLTGCSNSYHSWKNVSLRSQCPSIVYSKKYLPTNDEFRGIEVELISVGSETNLYLNIFILQYPCSQIEEGMADVTIQFNNLSYTTLGVLFQGRQRIMLSAADKEIILNALYERQPVGISVGQYSVVVDCPRQE